MRLELREVSRAFPGVAAVDRLSLDVGAGRIGCLLGPSGSGKTTVLRLIAGFERPDAGEVLAGGELLVGPGTLGAARAAAHRHGVPGLRAVPAPRRLRRTSLSACATRTRARAAGARRNCWSSSASRPRRAACRTSSRAASSSASRSHARSRRGRGSCCSTSRSRTSTPTCAWSLRSSCARRWRRKARRRCSSRTTSARRSRSPTRSA